MGWGLKKKGAGEGGVGGSEKMEGGGILLKKMKGMEDFEKDEKGGVGGVFFIFIYYFYFY